MSAPHLLRAGAALLLLCLVACRGESAPPAAAAPVFTATPDAAAAIAPAAGVATGIATAAAAAPATPQAQANAADEFDVASIPESTATLPPFPFFKEPEGLTSTLADKDRRKNFDREYMIASNQVVAIEGKVFRDRFQLTHPEQREYSDIEFQRNYADAIAALGGLEVSRVQYTNEINTAFGGRAAVDKHYHGTCASDGCENHTYLIRQAGKEYWIQVSTGAIPLHGELVVLERQAMASKLAFLDAAAMKQKLDVDGHVALYINFDTDKATLRSDATAVIEQITQLLQSDPTLKLSVEGHTDNTGGAEHNRSLSKARAEAVVAALQDQDIAAGRLQAAGYGPDKPLADNGNEAGRAKNRRVELVRID